MSEWYKENFVLISSQALKLWHSMLNCYSIWYGALYMYMMRYYDMQYP